jgi:hypothetical protein
MCVGVYNRKVNHISHKQRAVLKNIESRRSSKLELSWVVQLLKHYFYIFYIADELT